MSIFFIDFLRELRQEENHLLNKKQLISCEDNAHTLSAEYILACIRRC